WEEPPLLFDVTVHVGTTVAIILYFWRDWLRLTLAGLAVLRKRALTTTDERIIFYLIIGTIPAGLVGLALESYFESVFSDPSVVALMLMVTAGILYFSERMTSTRRKLESMNIIDSLFIGCAQAVAIVPGISRSGSTIAAGLVRNLEREVATRYSFLLATPIILAAGAKQAFEVFTEDIQIDSEMSIALVAGFIASAVVGYISIAFLLGFVRQRRLIPFAVYCLVFGIISFIATQIV
ncbi:MAG TPA: undecaprenyl-diphosphate phosphatase, partial [Aggregatilineales bacterium]|nr:undecaprenyl-diphosphate phosphatase [Aggregatilineales bacterium]